MTPAMSKKIIIIAGPNGAGKTTFAKDFLPQEAHTFRFINADLIAAGLAPFNPESVSFKAARLMLNELDEYTKAGESFAFETTLSGTHYLQRIEEWKDLGYTVKLWFIALSSPELATSRVAERVAQGGHNIPEDVIRRRYKAGLENLPKYQKAVNSWVLLDGDSIELEKIAQG
jgi:predicted ABC-type ATPase